MSVAPRKSDEGEVGHRSPDRDQLASALYKACHLTGTFTLRSGRSASYYFDKYQFEADPRLLGQITDALAELVPAGIDVLAGLEMGGIPVVTELSRRTGLPAAFVRKVAKTHGTARLAEGTPVDGMRLLIVEDVVTSGGQILLSSEDLRGLGAVVGHALCVVDRQEGGREALAGAGIQLRSLFTSEDLTATAG